MFGNLINKFNNMAEKAVNTINDMRSETSAREMYSKIGMITDDDINTIEKYCSSDLAERINALIKKNQGDDKDVIKITNTGMVSSGKSSLFNVLINDDIENSSEDFFKTGAARTTVSANSFRSNTVEYIDTPGIDVKEEDDEIAYKTIMSSDIIMMIHNIKTGPLHRSEAEWLERIVHNIGDTDAVKKRIIFVCSWKDTREKDDDYNDAITNLKNLVFDICGTEIPFFQVSVKKYIAGMEKNIEKLIVASEVNELKEYVNTYAREYSSIKTVLNIAEFDKLLLELKDGLSNVNSVKNSEIVTINNEIEQKTMNKKNIWDSLFNQYEGYKDNYINANVTSIIKEISEAFRALDEKGDSGAKKILDETFKNMDENAIDNFRLLIKNAMNGDISAYETIKSRYLKRRG